MPKPDGGPILVVNPNTSTVMTGVIRAAAAQGGGGRPVEVIQARFGPESIESRIDEVVSAYWAVDAVLSHRARPAGVVVACFSHHPAVPALREVVDGAVVDIMEAAVLAALPLGRTFSIVTTSRQWSRMLRDDLRAMGLDGRCVSVRNIDQTVDDVARMDRATLAAGTLREARAAVEADGAEVVCLGCAAMAGLEHELERHLGVPVLDGVHAGVRQVAGRVPGAARTRVAGAYAELERRPVSGLPSGLASVYRDGHRVDGLQER